MGAPTLWRVCFFQIAAQLWLTTARLLATESRRGRQVMGGGSERGDGALRAGAGARPTTKAPNEGEVVEEPPRQQRPARAQAGGAYAEPAEDPEAFLRQARSALGRGDALDRPAAGAAAGGRGDIKVDAERDGFQLDIPRGGGGGSGRAGDDGPSREFASAASSLLDDDFGAEVRARRAPATPPRSPSPRRAQGPRPARRARAG